MNMILLLVPFALEAGVPIFSQTTITGVWLSEAKDARIEVYIQGNSLFGRINWLQDPSSTDRQNPNPTLTQQPLIGMTILRNFKQEDSNTWVGGTIYDPANGKEYRCRLTLKGNKLEVRGYVGIPAFGRTSVWTRIVK